VLHAQNKVLQSEIQLLKARIRFAEDALNIEEEVAAEGEVGAQEVLDGAGDATILEDADADADEDDAAVLASEQAARSKGIRVRHTQLFSWCQTPTSSLGCCERHTSASYGP